MDASTAAVNDFIHQNQDCIDRVNDAIMAKDFSPVTELYFDLQVLKDTRMGLLLHLFPDKKEYLLQHLQEYNHRTDRKFLSVYDKLPMTEIMLKRRWGDPTLSEAIFNKSPDTDLSYFLPKLISQIQARNDRASYQGKIQLTINTYPLRIVPLMETYRDMLLHLFGKDTCTIRLISQEPKTLTAVFWQTMNQVYLDDLESMCSEDSGLYQPLLIENKLMSKEFYAPPQISDEVRKVWISEGVDLKNVDQVRERFSMTHIYFNLCCQFEYVFYKIPVLTEK